MLPPADSVTFWFQMSACCQHVALIGFKPPSDQNTEWARRPPHVPDPITLWSEEVSDVFTPINTCYFLIWIRIPLPGVSVVEVVLSLYPTATCQACFYSYYFDGDTNSNIFVSSKEIFLLLSLKLMRDYPVIPCSSNRPPYYSSLWNKHKQELRAKEAELDSKKATSSARGFWFRCVKHTDTHELHWNDFWCFGLKTCMWGQEKHSYPEFPPTSQAQLEPVTLMIVTQQVRQSAGQRRLRYVLKG